MALAWAAATSAAQAFPVGTRVIRVVDHSRSVRLPDGKRVSRTLVTYVRYPATSAATNAPPAPGGPYPLVVFAEGFNITPAAYAQLLDAWARAGYIVAAPLFPLTNPDAPGGPDESDNVNQPRDMSIVIDRMESGAFFRGAVSPVQIAVAGHSDGAVTALAVAYGADTRDPRVRAALVFAGAAIPPFTGFAVRPPQSPPLLAAQGTADPLNSPANTWAYYGAAPRPKVLLKLLGASHLPPFSYAQPWLRVVERVSTAFLGRYLRHTGVSLRRIARLGTVKHVASATYAR